MSDELEDPDGILEVAAIQHVRSETAGGIVRLTLDRPPANVLSVEMMNELAETLEALEYSRDVKLIVLCGNGRYFSAGFEIGDLVGEHAHLMLDAFHRILALLSRVDKPSLAVVAGPALGAGCQLAAACDITLASASAKLGYPEIRGGVFNAAAAAFLPRLVGPKRAFEMILGGGTLSAAEAEKIGLVTRAVPDERLEAEVSALIQRFQEGSAPVLQLARRAVAGGLGQLPEEALRHSVDVYLNQLMATEDAEEGLRAIMAKRKPVWKDR
jgi:cyclohexa-1,5-dienecarbonyl-CoA hydratase